MVVPTGGIEEVEIGVSSKAFLRTVDDSIHIDRARKKVEVTFTMYYAGRLASNALQGVSGASLRYIGISPDTALGVAHLYTLDVDGDAIRCAAIENILIATAQGNVADRRKWVGALAEIDKIAKENRN